MTEVFEEQPLASPGSANYEEPGMTDLYEVHPSRFIFWSIRIGKLTNSNYIVYFFLVVFSQSK